MATMYYRPYTAEPIREGEMPPYDAMESVLPEYQYIFTDGDGQPQGQRTHGTQTQRTTVTVRPAQSRPDDYGQPMTHVVDTQLREVDNYRSALTRMGHDIVSLRNTVRTLENQNSHLRSDLSQHNNATQLIIDSTEMDRLSKNDLASCYAQLKQKLASQTTSLKMYKDKVQKLQNELIRKNDHEKEYLKMRTAHSSQQELLQRLQEKILKLQKLEEACRKQERVIEKLERIIAKLRRQPQGDGAASDIKDALAEENRRLRQQIMDLQEQLKAAGRGSGEDLEKLELYQALERAEGRIMALEKELAENARNFGRERADMSIRLNEAEHGLGRNAALVASREYPSLEELRLQRTLRLDPLLR